MGIVGINNIRTSGSRQLSLNTILSRILPLQPKAEEDDDDDEYNVAAHMNCERDEVSGCVPFEEHLWACGKENIN